MLNLTSNAVKFTAQGRVVLRVSLSPGAPDDSQSGTSWLYFSVNDTGPGIPEEMRERLRAVTGIWKERAGGKSTDEIMKEIRGDE